MDIPAEGLRLSPAQGRPWHLPVVVGILSLALSWATFSLLSDDQDRAQRLEFQRDAASLIDDLRHEFAMEAAAVEALVAFDAGSNEVEPDEFHAFCAPLLAQYGAAGPLLWIDAGPQRTVVLVAGQHEVVSPGEDLVVDTAADDAFARAEETGRSATSVPFRHGGRRVLLVVAPIYDKNDDGTRTAVVASYVGRMLRIDHIAAAAFNSPIAIARSEQINLELMDTTDEGDPYVIIDHVAGDSAVAEPFLGTRDVRDRTWSYRCTPTSAFMAAERTGLPELAFVAGLLITALLVTSLWMLAGRTARVETLVEERTRELDASRRELMVARDAAESGNRAKGEFLANMSHEIRTPMSSVIGMAEMLLETELTRQQREYAEIVLDSAEGLLTILNDILDFSKIDAGQMSLEQQPFTLRSTINSALRTLAPRAAARGLELVCDIDADVPEGVIGDAGRLRQVLLNLVGNAIKFTPTGHVIVRVSTTQLADEFVVLTVRVTDTGIGMSADELQRVFDPFAQADSSVTRRFGGTGLGLAITRDLIERMHGSIEADSVPGAGSTFAFTVRLGREPLRPIIEPRRLDPLSGRRVILVEDHGAAADAERRLLESLGMTVHTVTDAATARTLLPEADMAVIDATLPDQDGVDLAATCTIPTVLLVPADRPLARGSAVPLIKPIGLQGLATALTAALGGRGKSEEATATQAERPLSILLAEDGRVNQLVAVRVLERRGHQVDVVEDGKAAVDAAERGTYDVVVMDIQMPVMGGLEAAEKIRSHEAPSHRRVPIIALTAHALRGDRARCVEAGIDAFLAKPIRAAELTAAVETAAG